jgi:hypothetical protein
MKIMCDFLVWVESYIERFFSLSRRLRAFDPLVLNNLFVVVEIHLFFK